MAEFKDRLKQAMQNAGLNQTELSKKTEIRQSSISDWLKGRYLAKQDKVELLARVLNVSPTWLMGMDDVEEPTNNKPSPNKSPIPETLAAHFEGKEFDEDDLRDIANFVEFVAQRKKQ